MGRIKVKVSQGGGTEDDVALGINDLKMTLTAEDASTGGSLPASTSVSLTVNGQIVGNQTTPSGSNTVDNLSYSYGQNAVGLAYSVSIAGVDPSQIDYDPNATVQRSFAAAAEMSRAAVEVPAPEPTRRAMSFFQKIISFLRRLFGQRPQ